MREKTGSAPIQRRRVEVACLVGLAGLAGCASPGVPRPPSLKLPAMARGLTAERVGDEVRLRWTTPSETTDGDTIKGNTVAVVCREERVPGPCMPVERRELTPGPSQADVMLTGDLAAGPARLLGFRVELQNAKGRSEGPTSPVYVASGKAPGPVEGLRVTASRDGALLRWQKVPDGAGVEVRRDVVDGGPGAPAVGKGGLFGVKEDKAEAAVLRAGTTDVGGMVDREAVRLVKYRYTAQRVLSVTVGGRDLTMRGPESAAVVWTLQDVLPPDAPTGLVAVPGPGSIDLSWDVVPDRDVAGYIVLRRDENGPEQRLNTEVLVAPGFRDMTAMKGIPYRYSITSVDKSGNQSKPSAEVRETLR